MTRWGGVLASALLCASCGSDAAPVETETGEGAAAGTVEALNPTETLQRFYDALAAGKVEDALVWMVPLSDPKLRELFPADLGKVVEMCTTGELKLQALEHSEQGRWACVVTRHELVRDGETSVMIRDEFLLSTPDGWRIVTEPARKDPAVAPLWDADAFHLLNAFRSNHDAYSAKYR